MAVEMACSPLVVSSTKTSSITAPELAVSAAVSSAAASSAVSSADVAAEVASPAPSVITSSIAAAFASADSASVSSAPVSFCEFAAELSCGSSAFAPVTPSDMLTLPDSSGFSTLVELVSWK